MVIASVTAAGSSDQRYRSRAAASVEGRRVQQGPQDGLGLRLPEVAAVGQSRDIPVPADRPRARIIAICGTSHPRTGDQRSPSGTPAARPCGSKTATGPTARRAA